MSRGGNIQGVAHLHSHNYFVTESLNIVQKVMNGHKNPNDIHNFFYEYHDEIEFYQENSNRST